jgi:hypothetical protein
MDPAQEAARLLSPALFQRGRFMIAPPSVHSSCWRVFGGGLSAEVRQHTGAGICSYVLKGPDGKTLRQGVASHLESGLWEAMDSLQQLCDGDFPAAA